MSRHRNQTPKRLRLATVAVVAVGVLFGVFAGIPGSAFGGPDNYVHPKFTAPLTAVAGETVSASPEGSCRAGHGGRGRFDLFSREDGGGSLATSTFTVGRDNRWPTTSLRIPADLRPGTYILSASCGGAGGTVNTSYALREIRISGACQNPLFIGLRGSGESPSNLGMGPTGDYVFRMTQQLSGRTLDSINRSAQNGYDAVKPDVFQYRGSMNTGKNLALQYVRTKIAACGASARIVMMGYSQGAEAVYEALRVMSSSEREKVRGVVLFGSPVHTPFLNGDAGPSHSIGLFGGRPALGDGLPSRMRDYCNYLDPVCATPGALPQVGLPAVAVCVARGSLCTHFHYTGTHGDQAARYLADRLR